MRAERRRFDPAMLHVPLDDLRAGVYADAYFNRARAILVADAHRPRVRMQVFVRTDALLCGVDEALAVLRVATGEPAADGIWRDGWPEIVVRALYDGDHVSPFETMMTIEGDYALFAHLETTYLGVLTRRTRIATNGRALIDAAAGKNVLFFPARYDHAAVQAGDGYAAHMAGVAGVSTDAGALWYGGKGLGTIPHALIAAYGGDTVLATQKFAEHIDPAVNVIALVDFDNDCVGATLAAAQALGARLWGVRLDTSGTLVDRSLIDRMGTFVPTGVNAELVRTVRAALDTHGFAHVRIIASGGFDAAKIRMFEAQHVPVDAYAVGSAFFENAGAFDFTADIVAIDDGAGWRSLHKAGRPERPNPRLERVEP